MHAHIRSRTNHHVYNENDFTTDVYVCFVVVVVVVLSGLM